MSEDGRYQGSRYIYRHETYMPKALAKVKEPVPFAGLPLRERSRLMEELARARAAVRAMLITNATKPD